MLSSLSPSIGSVKKVKRIARGQGSGHGGTSTRGHKGAKSRSGYKSKRAFEGGQMPLQMRLPKVGFNNINRKEYVVFSLETLDMIREKYNVNSIDKDLLYNKGYIKKRDNIKVLSDGDLKSSISVICNKISKSAKTKIESLGGSVSLI